MEECREEAVRIPFAKEYLLLETGQSVMYSLLLNTPLTELSNEKNMPCMLTFLGYKFPVFSRSFGVDSGLLCLKLLGYSLWNS